MSKKYLLFLLTLLAVGIIGATLIRDHRDTGSEELKIVFMDIGQGDSFLVVTPDNYTMLVDAGKGNQVSFVLPGYLGLMQRHIDVVIGTHPDADHIEGLVALLKSYSFSTVLLPKVGKQTALAEYLYNLLLDDGVSTIWSSGADDFMLGCCVFVDILWPTSISASESYADVNDASIAFILTYNGFKLYAGGDLSAHLEYQSVAELSASYSDVDVLKVGHHGSKTSTGEDFLYKIKPEVAIISVGENNSYGHPHKQVLSNLEQIGARVMRTDLLGSITLSVSPGSYSLTSQKGLVELHYSL